MATKKKACMNYSEFMTKFNGGSKTYAKKANIANKDAASKKTANQDMATLPGKGTGTQSISRFTKEHLANAKKKSGVKTKGTTK